MKAAELEPGEVYVTGYGDEYLYLGPWQGPVRQRSGWRPGNRPARASDLLVLRWWPKEKARAVGAGLRDYAVKGGLWAEEVINSATLKQKASALEAKRSHDQAVYQRYLEEAKALAARLKAAGIDPGRKDPWGGGYDRVEIPHLPRLASNYTGEAVFSRQRITVHLNAEEVEKLLP